MEKLGNPQNELQMIHVAGTNGKGSTVAFFAVSVYATRTASWYIYISIFKAV